MKCLQKLNRAQRRTRARAESMRRLLAQATDRGFEAGRRVGFGDAMRPHLPDPELRHLPPMLGAVLEGVARRLASFRIRMSADIDLARPPAIVIHLDHTDPRTEKRYGYGLRLDALLLLDSPLEIAIRSVESSALALFRGVLCGDAAEGER